MADRSPESLQYYRTLAEALRERLAVIADRPLRERDPARHLEQLKSASQQIALLQANLPKDASPQLVHFLDRCSYEKALAFLESNEGSQE